jgi:predicted AAA+ superfamily ATPase
MDEFQTLPNLFVQLRPEIDAYRRPGRFLLLGSANGVLLRQTAESLAGRVSYLQLPPLLWSEVQAKVQLEGTAHQEATSDPAYKDTHQLLALQSHWPRGGMPLSCLAKTDAQALPWRKRTYSIFNASALDVAVAMGRISPITLRRYLDIFCDALIVRKVEPYCVSPGKRLVKSPKVYFRDADLLNALLGISKAQDLEGHPMSGFSWEGLVVDHIATLLPLVTGGDESLHFFLNRSRGRTRRRGLHGARAFGL